MGVKLQSSSGGSVEIAAPVTASNYVLTAPATSSTIDTLARAGNVLQVVRTNYSTFVVTTAFVPSDNTIPQNTEGAELFTCSITPISASSTLQIEVVANTANSSVATTNGVFLFRDSVANAMVSAWCTCPGVQYTLSPLVLKTSYSPGSTSAITFKVRGGTVGGSGAQAFQLNGSSGAAYFGGTLISSITITEIAG